jgi:hypothetical protein
MFYFFFTEATQYYFDSLATLAERIQIHFIKFIPVRTLLTSSRSPAVLVTYSTTELVVCESSVPGIF